MWFGISPPFLYSIKQYIYTKFQSGQSQERLPL